jgi:L-malate glycosyltransferase
MRVLILTPKAFPAISGNAVTCERWRLLLTKKGISVEVLASEGLAPDAFLDHVQRFSPDLIHVHHAFRAGALLVNPNVIQRHAGLTMVTSPGGTDINEDLAKPDRRDTVYKVLQMARIIIAQSPEVVQHFKRHLPALSERIMIVPKTVCWFGDEQYDLRTAAECGPEDILFLLPSGIRPVKGNLECLEMMRQVYDLRPKIRFVAAGPAVDVEYAARFEREILDHSVFARWIKTISPAAMRSVYRASDAVLNTSLSEGLSNSLMEAIAAGRPVLASNIQGNRWPVLGEDGDAPAGLLFDLHNHEDFIEKALMLIDDASRRESLGLAGISGRSRLADAEDEADGLIAAYKAALNKS